MQWYRLYARHGPGHQGFTETYKLFPKDWDDEILEYELEDWVWDTRLDNVIAYIEPVDGLPQEIINRKINHYKARILNAQEMLEILANTKVVEN